MDWVVMHMSFQEEMSELGRKHQYAFDEQQVEACACELYKIIQADLKAEAAAGRLIPFGLFGQKKGVEHTYSYSFVGSTSTRTPYLIREQTSTSIRVYKGKEFGALVKRLKKLGAVDDIRIRVLGGEDNTYISALYELR